MPAALHGLTTRGRCFLAGGAAAAACAVVLGQRDLMRVGLLLLALPLVAAAVVSRTRYRLACTRTLDPARTEAGRPSTVRLRLDNVSRLPSGVLLLEDRLPYNLGGRPRFVLDKVQPRGVREVDYDVVSEVRGRYRVGPLAVRLTDPFGLCELTRSFSSTEDLVVTPPVWPLPPTRLGGDWTAGGDNSARAVSTSGDDDAATREYRHGDDLRKVHWRSTARTGELMVRREEQPWQSRAAVLLDARTSAHRGDGPDSSFEYAVAATASVGVHLLSSGFSLRLLDDEGGEFSADGLSMSGGLVLDRLAEVGPSSGRTLTPAIARLRRRGGEGLLVAVLGALGAEEAAEVARLRHGTTACVAILLDTRGWLGAGPRARTDTTLSLDDSTQLLTRAGWRVLPVRPGTSLATVWPRAGMRPDSGSVPEGPAARIPAGAR